MESDCRHCARVVDWQVALVEFLQHSLHDDPLLYPMLDICFEFSGGRCRSDRVRNRLMKCVGELIEMNSTEREARPHVWQGWHRHVMTRGGTLAVLWPLVTNTACSETTFQWIRRIFEYQYWTPFIQKATADLWRLFISLFPHLLMTSSSAAEGIIACCYQHVNGTMPRLFNN